MGQAWRIVMKKHAGTAFDGEGARLNGGRWNSIGVRVVYVSLTKSLAALETLVHLKQPVTSKYVAIPLQFDDALIESLPPATLPAGWDAEPPSPASQQIGNDWVRTSRSTLLALPSVITGETNYLINPAHPGFGKIKIGKPQSFTFDPRLLA
ncbi:MAG TPA: RES family NAD+ phosphorylase [Verrucomicrobiae bacterium]|jgi:RES domain-containing protein